MRMLILSSKHGLQSETGQEQDIARAVRQYITERKQISVKFIYYDEPNPYTNKPVKKNARNIRDFVSKIEEKWGQLDILLLLGGDRIVPFFRLDNPCDDSDNKVLSDNPYASRDDDYLIPERVCSRIPDKKDAGFIIGQLQKEPRRYKRSFGISAKIWEAASKDVYRCIGNTRSLKTSPPVDHTTFKGSWLKTKDYLYFNLHGARQSAYWYGQDGDLYPRALGPEHIDRASGIVAAECCYGAYIIKKTDKTALALKFLAQKDIQGFFGSTTIAYGPVKPPSSEADLLTRYFFGYLEQGMTAGESARNAKQDFARKMLRQQGFLDDDDQKTLLQFVLYGDPMAQFARGKKKRTGA
jgi:hypothetical protein